MEGRAGVTCNLRFFLFFEAILVATIDKAKAAKVAKAIQELIDAGLVEALSGQPTAVARVLGRPAIHKISKRVAARAVADPALIEAMGGLVETTKVREADAWLSTEEAARRTGFSRPFIIALLDGPNYPGKVNRSPKGHRRVLASELDQWLAGFGATQTSVRAQTVADTRREAILGAKPPTQSEVRARASSHRKALARARALGIA